MKNILVPLADRAYALLRIVAGAMLMCHGLQKLFGVLGGQQPAVGSQLWLGRARAFMRGCDRAGPLHPAGGVPRQWHDGRRLHPVSLEASVRLRVLPGREPRGAGRLVLFRVPLRCLQGQRTVGTRRCLAPRCTEGCRTSNTLTVRSVASRVGRGGCQISRVWTSMEGLSVRCTGHLFAISSRRARWSSPRGPTSSMSASIRSIFTDLVSQSWQSA